MFLFKKIVAPLFFPLSLGLIIFAVALVLLLFTRRQRIGKVLASAAFVLLAVSSYRAVSYPMLRSLERVYPLPSAEAVASAKWVVVLGGDTLTDTSLPVTVRAAGATLSRLVEGMRLHREIPGSRLVISGAASGPGSDTEVMVGVVAALGMSMAGVVVDGISPDTESQAVNVAAIVKDDPCLIVTSALHMPRAMALFEKAGVRATAAPAQFVTEANREVKLIDFYPAAFGLVTMQIAANEYLGRAWARLRGRA